MNMNEANVRLERFYNTVEQYRPTAHINRIYFHAGYTIEEVIANLRGIMALFAEQVGEVQDKLNDLLTRIELILQKIIDEKEPEIVAQIIGDITEKLTNAMSLYNGVPQLSRLLYEDNEDKVFNSDNKSANAVANLVSPRVARNTATQNLWHDPHDGSWFFTQSDTFPGIDKEGFVISHTDAQGDFASSMWVKGGGHGQQVDFLVNNGQVFVIDRLKNGYKTFQFKGRSTIDLSNETDVWQTPGGKILGHVNYTDTPFGDVLFEYTNWSVYAYKAKWDGSASKPEFSGEGAEFNLKPYLTDIYVNQGFTAVPEQEISGVPSKNILVIVGFNTDGWSEGENHNAVIKVLRYDYERNTIEYVKEISRLDQGFKPAFGSDTNHWASNEQELEGIVRIRANAGSTSKQELGGLAWAINTGESNQKTVFVMGFVAPNLLANMATAKVRNQRRAMGDYEETAGMYNLLKPGRYLLTGAEMGRYRDTPMRWRGMQSLGTFSLDVSKPDAWGNVTQILTLGGRSNPIDTYQRNVVFDSNNGWGETYNPLSGTWQKVSSYHTDTHQVGQSYITNSGVKKLSQLTEPNTWFYLSNADALTLGLGGLETVIGGSGFKFKNDPEGHVGVDARIRQTVVIVSDVRYISYTRLLTGTRDEFGPGLDRSKDIQEGAWFKVEGTQI